MRYIIIFFLLCSCSVRKVETSKDIIKETDKIEVVDKTISIDKDTTSIKTIEDYDIYTIEPVDSTKDMLVDGKTYKNVRLKKEKKKLVSNIQNKKIVEIKANTELKVNNNKEVVKVDKNSKRTSPQWLVYIVIIIIVVLYSLKNKIISWLI